jgi:hypothetical protein
MKTTNLRIPDDIHEAMKESAKNNYRSLNAEILYAMEKYISTANISLGTSVSFALRNLPKKKTAKKNGDI